MSGAPRWWRREADEATALARDAKGRAAVTLLELDTVQREVEREVEEYADFAPGDGPRLTSRWAPLRDEAFAVTSGYLDVEQRYDLETDLGMEQARTAAVEFAKVGAAMSDVARRVTAFGEAAEPKFAQVRRQVAELTVAMRELDPTVTAARRAVADARAAGLLTVDPDVELTAAEAAAARAHEGDAVHGLRATQEAARLATAHARAALELARQYPRDGRKLLDGRRPPAPVSRSPPTGWRRCRPPSVSCASVTPRRPAWTLPAPRRTSPRTFVARSRH